MEKERECSSTFLNELQDGVLGVDVDHNQCSQRDTCLLGQLPPHQLHNV